MGNVISGNRSIGVQILGNQATSNIVIGNVIGTDLAGTARLGNSIGVFVYAEAGNAVAGNVTAFNAQGAVKFRRLVDGPEVQGVAFQTDGAGHFTGAVITFTNYLDRARAQVARKLLAGRHRPDFADRDRPGGLQRRRADGDAHLRPAGLDGRRGPAHGRRPGAVRPYRPGRQPARRCLDPAEPPWRLELRRLLLQRGQGQPVAASAEHRCPARIPATSRRATILLIPDPLFGRVRRADVFSMTSARRTLRR